MKLHGEKIKPPGVQALTLRKGKKDEITLFMGPVMSYEELEETLPRPKPPIVQMGEGISFPDNDDEDYIIAIGKWASMRTNWTILQSLSCTEDLEWETVKLNDPNTWENWTKEFKESFTENEIVKIQSMCFEVNGLLDDTVRDSRESFLKDREAEAQAASSSQKDEQSSTKPGEDLND